VDASPTGGNQEQGGTQYIAQTATSTNSGSPTTATAISGTPDQIYMAVTTNNGGSAAAIYLSLPEGTVTGQMLVVRHDASTGGSANHTLNLRNSDGSHNVQNFSPWSAGQDYVAISYVWSGSRWYMAGKVN
jgi:hypothetical protein